jgi:hydrogenase maturation factor
MRDPARFDLDVLARAGDHLAFTTDSYVINPSPRPASA